MTKSCKKVLFVLPGLQAGGAERVLINLMNSLPAGAYDKSIAVVNTSGPLKSLIKAGTPFFDLKSRTVISSLPALYKIWKRQRPDIVVSTMTHMNFGVLLLKPFFGSTKIIVREAIVPSYFFDKYRHFRTLLKCAYKYLYKKADVILAPSDLILWELRALPGMADYKYRLLYNPVANSNALIRPPPKNGHIEFVSIGRLDTQKGLDLLINALHPTSLESDWQWRIVGEGPQRDELNSLIARRNLADNIVLEGFQSNPAQYYIDADILLLPSRWEGLPNVVLESLSYGTPVIALHSAGGISEIAAMCSNDSVQIASSIEEFIEKMRQVETKKPNSFLLPDAFKSASVFAHFQKILNQV